MNVKVRATILFMSAFFLTVSAAEKEGLQKCARVDDLEKGRRWRIAHRIVNNGVSTAVVDRATPVIRQEIPKPEKTGQFYLVKTPEERYEDLFFSWLLSEK